MLTLYGNLESGNVYKVRLILALTGVKHRRFEVNQVKGDPRSPAYRAMAPIGKVPAVKFDDGRVMMESGALLYFFALGSKYWPRDKWDQTSALQWMFFEQYTHEPAIAVNRYLMHYAPPGDPRRNQIALNAEKGNFALSVMEKHLTANDWFCPAGYSIADMALYAYTHVADEGGFDLSTYPKVRAWIARVASQPAHVPMMQETSAEPVQKFSQG